MPAAESFACPCDCPPFSKPLHVSWCKCKVYYHLGVYGESSPAKLQGLPSPPFNYTVHHWQAAESHNRYKTGSGTPVQRECAWGLGASMSRTSGRPQARAHLQGNPAKYVDHAIEHVRLNSVVFATRAFGAIMQQRPRWSKTVGMQHVHQTRPRAEMAGGTSLTVQQQSMSPMLICNATTQCHSQTGSSPANLLWDLLPFSSSSSACCLAPPNTPCSSCCYEFYFVDVGS